MHAVMSTPHPPHSNNGWSAPPAGYQNMVFRPRQMESQSNSAGSSSNSPSPMRSRHPPAPSDTQFDNDPAFSNDPSDHPDFFQPVVREDIRITNPGRTPVENGRRVDPPAYEDAVSGAISPLSKRPEVHGLQSIDDESPGSSRQSMPEDEEQAEEEELLAYLREDRNDQAREVDRNYNPAEIPLALRPRRGAPLPPDTLVPMPHWREEERGRAAIPPAQPQPLMQMPPDLVRSATAPPIPMRTIEGGSGFPNGVSGRPQIQRRVNTGSPHRPSNLDRIDELDESVPNGGHMHLRGPYEVERMIATPPAQFNFTPEDRIRRNQSQAGQRHLIIQAEDPPEAPPAPMPFKLDLRPGEFLTRVPTTRRSKPPTNRGSPPALLHSQAPSSQAPPRSLRHGANELANPSFHLRNQDHMNWTPEQLYDTFAPVVVPPNRRQNLPMHYPGEGSLYSSGPSSTNSSRSDLPYPPSNGRPLIADNPAQKRVGFDSNTQTIPASQSQISLSRSVSQPVMSKPGSFSSSSTSLSQGLPPSDRHRPRQIIMPSPLRQQQQNQNPNQSYQTYTSPSALVPTPRPMPQAAAVIPMHDAKKSNILRKRNTTTAATRSPAQETSTPAPVRKPSTSRGLFGFGSPRNSVNLEDSGTTGAKTGRKLSKRRT